MEKGQTEMKKVEELEERIKRLEEMVSANEKEIRNIREERRHEKNQADQEIVPLGDDGFETRRFRGGAIGIAKKGCVKGEND